MNYNDKIIEKRMKEKQERIEKAIDRKEKSIAFWCSVERAVELVTPHLTKLNKQENVEKAIKQWRDWFYQEWQAWYLENIIALETQKRSKKEAEASVEDEIFAELEEAEVEWEEELKRAEAEADYLTEQKYINQ